MAPPQDSGITLFRLRCTPLRGIFLFAALFIYLWHFVRTDLFYYAFGIHWAWPEYSPRWAFARECLAEPGGCVQYLNGLLSQWFYYPLAGALILTAVVWLICAGVQKSAGGRWLRWSAVSYLPGLAAIIVTARYAHILDTLLGVAVSLWAVVLFRCIPVRRYRLRCLWFGAVFALLYYLAAAISVVFAATTVLLELVKDRRPLLALGYAVIAVSLAYALGVGLFFLEPHDALTRLLPLDPEPFIRTDPLARRLTLAIAFAPPLVVMVLAFELRLLHRLSATPRTTAAATRKASTSTQATVRRWVLRAAPTLLIVAAAVLALSWPANPRRYVMKINACSRQRRWSDVLRTAADFRNRGFYDICAIFDVNRALYHTGRLGEEMFAWPQTPDALTLFGAQGVTSYERYARIVELAWDLGDCNMAEHWVVELLEAQGNVPYFLEMYARILIAKEQPEGARVLLNRLADDPIYRERARAMLKELHTDPTMATDKDIQQVRALRPTHDRPAGEESVDQYLIDLLVEHQDNRMAFEYLVSHYMLNLQQDKAVFQLQRLPGLGYKRLPRHWAEAAMIAASKSGRPVNLAGFEMPGPVAEEYKAIIAAARAAGPDRLATGRALAPRFGSSYFFYSLFGYSGAAR